MRTPPNSFGGGVALQMAAQAPDKVRRLIIASAPFARNGFFAEMLPQQAAVSGAMADMMKETPMYTRPVSPMRRRQTTSPGMGGPRAPVLRSAINSKWLLPNPRPSAMRCGPPGRPGSKPMT